MTNYSVGHEAEKHAVEFLKSKKYKIIDTNWRTRFCEIDIVAENKKKIYFFEVKYRLNNLQGSGIEYITAAKIKQMQFAADFWVQAHHWKHDYTLGAIELTGQSFKVTNYLTELD